MKNVRLVVFVLFAGTNASTPFQFYLSARPSQNHRLLPLARESPRLIPPPLLLQTRGRLS